MKLKNPTQQITWAVMYSVMILIAFLLICSCKSRKVEKDYSKSIDKSEITSTVRENRTVQDTAKASIKTDVKEATETNNTFDTEETTVINYDSLGRIKTATINRKSKEQNKSNSSKTDNSIIDFIAGHSEIKSVDSAGNKKNDIKAVTKTKSVDAKMNWVKLGVGAGVFILILFVGIFVFRRYK